jgi:alcohol dehydrogenase (cytochrome c)
LDPVTAEVFVPVGNPVPDFAPNDRPGANLFTDSVVAFDARTGALKWWYQLVPHDGRDLDLGAAPMLYRDKLQRNVVALAGKDGFLHVVDRETHRLLFKTPVTTIENSALAPTAAGTKFCPGAAGGVEWNGPAFDPMRRILAVGSVDWCHIIKAGQAKYEAGTLAFGGTWQLTGDIPRGWIVAVDADTGAVQWRYHADAPVVSGLTLTAGGVALGGDSAGNFLVLDSKNGAVLKKVPTGGALAGGIITYEIGGRQYIAVTSGISRSIYGASSRPSLIVMSTDVPLSGPSGKSTMPDVAHGRNVFRQSCVGCHGTDGNNVSGFDLRLVKQHMTPEQLISWLENPAPPMPKVFPSPLDDDDRRDIRDVGAYLLEGLP